MPPDEDVPAAAPPPVEPPSEPVSPEAASLVERIAGSVREIEFRLSGESSRPRNDLRLVEADIAQCQADIDRLKGELESAGQTIEEKKGQKDAARQRLNDLSGELQVLNELLHLRKEGKITREREYNDLADTEGEMNESIRKTDKDIQEATGELGSFSNDPDGYEQQIGKCRKLSGDLRRLKEKLSQIINQKEQANRAKTKTSADHHNAEETAGLKASEVESTRRTHSEISDALQAATEEFDGKGRELGDANKRLEGLQVRKKELKEQLSRFIAQEDVLKRLKDTTRAGQEELDRSSELGGVLEETKPKINDGLGAVLIQIKNIREELDGVQLELAGRFAVVSFKLYAEETSFSARVAALSGLLEALKGHASKLEDGDDETSWAKLAEGLELLERLLAEEDEEARQQHEAVVQDLSKRPSALAEEGLREIGEFDPAKVEPLKTALAAMEERAKGAEAARETATAALTEKETVLTQTQERVVELEKSERDLKAGITELEEAVAEARSERDRAKGEVTSGNEVLAAAEERLRGLGADLGTARKDLIDVRADLTQMTGERDDLIAEKARLDAEVKRLTDALQDSQEDMGVLRGQVRDAGTSVAEKTAAAGLAEVRAGRAEAEVGSLRSARDAALANAREAREEAARLRRELDELKRAGDTLRMQPLAPAQPEQSPPPADQQPPAAEFDDE